MPKRLLVTILIGLLTLLGAGPAWAHPQILAIEPPPDAQLHAAPPLVVITFNEPIEALSTLALYDSRGAPVAEGGGRDPADPARLALDLPPLPPGLYTAVWTAAGSDGHVVRGNFSFTVLGAAAPAAPTAPADTPPPAAAPAPPPPAPVAPEPFPLLQSGLRWMLLLGATGAVGGWVFWRWVGLPALGASGTAEAAFRRWRPWGVGALLLVAAGSPLLLLATLSEIAGRIGGELLLAGLGTRQWMLLAARAALALALLALTAITRSTRALRRHSPAAHTLGAALLFTYALAGHAGAAAQPSLAVMVGWLHLAATSAWVGGLLALVLCLPALGADPRALRSLLGRFSPLAIGGVAVLALSGAAAALREIPAPADLWQTAYGRALSLKLLLFGGMLLLGAAHLRAGRAGGDPAAASRPRLGRSLRAEGGLALLALGAAALLTSLPPPAAGGASAATPPPTPTAVRVPTVTPGPTRTPVPSRPFDQTRLAGDIQVRLAVEPASLGENRFAVTVRDSAGQIVTPQLVRLTFAMREMDMGENVLEAQPTTGDPIALSGSPLSMVGDWQVTVLVRRAGRADVTAMFEVPVGE